MNIKIDGIFDCVSYRYIPYELKSEWKTLINYYKSNYFENKIKLNSLFDQIKIDIYNEELNRLNNIEIICNNFNKKIKNIHTKYECEKKYGDYIQKNLHSNVNEIKKFINIKKQKLYQKIKENNILNDKINYKIIESFNDNNKKEINKKCSIIIILMILLLTIYSKSIYNYN